MVSSTPEGNGFPIGEMPGALPSDHASRQTLKTTAVRLPFGHTQFTGFVMLHRAPDFGSLISGAGRVGKAKRAHAERAVQSHGRSAWARRKDAPLPTLRLRDRNAPNLSPHCGAPSCRSDRS